MGSSGIAWKCAQQRISFELYESWFLNLAYSPSSLCLVCWLLCLLACRRQTTLGLPGRTLASPTSISPPSYAQAQALVPLHVGHCCGVVLLNVCGLMLQPRFDALHQFSCLNNLQNTFQTITYHNPFFLISLAWYHWIVESV